MDLLGSLGVLVRVVETGSFSAVARERELSQAAVARQISPNRSRTGSSTTAAASDPARRDALQRSPHYTSRVSRRRMRLVLRQLNTVSPRWFSSTYW